MADRAPGTWERVAARGGGSATPADLAAVAVTRVPDMRIELVDRPVVGGPVKLRPVTVPAAPAAPSPARATPEVRPDIPVRGTRQRAVAASPPIGPAKREEPGPLPSERSPRRRAAALPSPDGVPASATAVPAICPLLGLKNDPLTRFENPHPAHHCHATGISATITAEHQAAYCYAAYQECIRYRVHMGDMQRIAERFQPGRASARPGTGGSA